jgi:hypothetical protein
MKLFKNRFVEANRFVQAGAALGVVATLALVTPGSRCRCGFGPGQQDDGEPSDYSKRPQPGFARGSSQHQSAPEFDLLFLQLRGRPHSDSRLTRSRLVKRWW